MYTLTDEVIPHILIKVSESIAGIFKATFQIESLNILKFVSNFKEYIIKFLI